MQAKKQSMEDIISRLDRSAKLVQAWGKQTLRGHTISETFTFNGMPLWDVLSVDLARVYVPEILAHASVQQPWFNRQIRPHLGVIKYNVKNRLSNLKYRNLPSHLPSDSYFLFLGFADYIYRDVLMPVVGWLDDQEAYSSVILNDQLLPVSEISGNGESCFRSVWQYLDRDVRIAAKKTCKEFLQVYKQVMASQVLFSALDDQERACWPQMESMFHRFFRFYMVRFLNFSIIAKYILDRYPPSLIVSSDVADPRSRMYCLYGQKLGVPVLELQFGAYGRDSIEWQFFDADQLAVWGATSRDVMINQGIPETKIIITGSPRHDYVHDTIGDSPQVIAKKKTVILFASVYYLKAYAKADPEQYNALIAMKKALFQTVEQYSDLQMIVKPHPQENILDNQELVGSMKNIEFVDQKLDIRDLIKSCDCFVSLGSTATIDALIANKLIICPFFPGWGWSSSALVESGTCLVPKSKQELDGIFHKLAVGCLPEFIASLAPHRERFLQEWLCKNDGQNTKRVAHLALDMAQ